MVTVESADVSSAMSVGFGKNGMSRLWLECEKFAVHSRGCQSYRTNEQNHSA
ncbi:hypothetical protein M407DRAFT_241634 [Tulasnella calospora MUT 4182]|uniref:Uncharacterized protein n=1 Tax=Tulasnella calospora MUT 4182 TaxID=1051891 RepID=A0A0C3QIK3_9AGAM|nr:hypothetical protein M407DRAFT_241634 [Tulasnella calospora MUT 4182]